MIHLSEQTWRFRDTGMTFPFPTINILMYLSGQNETLPWDLSMPTTPLTYDYDPTCCTFSSTTGATTNYTYDPGNPSINTGKSSSFYNYDDICDLHPCESRSTDNATYVDSNLHYYGYRYYNPELGRWVSRDPIGENAARYFVGGVLYSYLPDQVWFRLFSPLRQSNGYCYAFVRNQPISDIDVLGLEEAECCGNTLYDPEDECCVAPDDVQDRADNPQVCVRGIILPGELIVHCYIDIGGGDYWDYDPDGILVEDDISGRCVPLECGDKCITENQFRERIESDRGSGDWDGEDWKVTHNCCHWIDHMLRDFGCSGTETHFPGYVLPPFTEAE